MWLRLEINPEPWAIGPVGVSRKEGRIGAYVGRNQQLDAYKEAIREAVNAELSEPPEKFPTVALSLYFWRNRAEYVTPQSRNHRKHEADLTNLQKATEDALQGIFFDNDRDVKEIHSYMVQQGPEITGSVVLEVREYTGSIELPGEAWDCIKAQALAQSIREIPPEDLDRSDVPF